MVVDQVNNCDQRHGYAKHKKEEFPVCFNIIYEHHYEGDNRGGFQDRAEVVWITVLKDKGNEKAKSNDYGANFGIDAATTAVSFFVEVNASFHTPVAEAYISN